MHLFGRNRDHDYYFELLPYDIEQAAEAVRLALEMDSEERKTRMQHMRRVVREHNVYRWAGSLIAELCEVRLDAASRPGGVAVGASAG